MQEQEPSVLDYLKAKLTPWRGPAPEIPPLPAPGAKRSSRVAKASPKPSTRETSVSPIDMAGIPWRTPLAFLLLVSAQIAWRPPNGTWFAGLPLALAALGLIIWSAKQGEWRLPEIALGLPDQSILIVRRIPLVIGLVFFAYTLLTTGGNQFALGNVASWFIAILATMGAFWQGMPTSRPDLTANIERFKVWIQQQSWRERLSGYTLAILVAFGIAAFFRFYQLSAVPPEMLSDHAEKLLDVLDIQNGQSPIFFIRNTGREPLQFYLTALIAGWFGTGLSFLSLKIGMALVGLFSLIYIYLLGKELGGRWVGILALLLMGVAYWPNVLARAGLRFILFPSLAAPSLYYLLRGLRRSTINDFLLSGLFLGIGLYGYTSFRIVPVVMVVALIVYWLHEKDRLVRRRALIAFAVLVLVSLVVFAPLLRYSLENWQEFSFRAFSRVGDAEISYPGPVFAIFLDNLLNALGLPIYSGGSIWLVGLLNRPALDLVSGALFLLGVALIVLRYLRTRNWQDLFLLLAVPLLMMPSILSLAFPEENPAMNRAGGAAVPVFIICAIALVAFVHAIKDRLAEKQGKWIGWGTGVLLVVIVMGLNYDLVFNQYNAQYRQQSWNSSEMGAVIREFSDRVGSDHSAWVVAYPHWVDTRLVAFNADQPGRELGLWPEELVSTLDVPEPKLFVLNVLDVDGLSTLQSLYPQGDSQLQTSEYVGKDFLVYRVEASQ